MKQEENKFGASNLEELENIQEQNPETENAGADDTLADNDLEAVTGGLAVRAPSKSDVYGRPIQ